MPPQGEFDDEDIAQIRRVATVYSLKVLFIKLTGDMRTSRL